LSNFSFSPKFSIYLQATSRIHAGEAISPCREDIIIVRTIESQSTARLYMNIILPSSSICCPQTPVCACLDKSLENCLRWPKYRNDHIRPDHSYLPGSMRERMIAKLMSKGCPHNKPFDHFLAQRMPFILQLHGNGWSCSSIDSRK
jgi:hypothetical protein